MAEIIPAILEKKFSEIKKKLAILRGRVECAQLDFCDGVFVHSVTWPFASGGLSDPDFRKIINEEEGLPYWQDFDFELDLMAMEAVENFDLYMKLGPKRIVFHLGAQKNPDDFAEFLEGIDNYVRDNTEIGLAFSPSDDLAVVTRLSHKVDFLQAMGIDQIGLQGQKFDEKVIENIKLLKNTLPGIVVAVDGGVNLEDAEAILAAGANRLAVGSAIWQSPDPIGALEKFQSLVK